MENLDELIREQEVNFLAILEAITESDFSDSTKILKIASELQKHQQTVSELVLIYKVEQYERPLPF